MVGTILFYDFSFFNIHAIQNQMENSMFNNNKLKYTANNSI